MLRWVVPRNDVVVRAPNMKPFSIPDQTPHRIRGAAGMALCDGLWGRQCLSVGGAHCARPSCHSRFSWSCRYARRNSCSCGRSRRPLRPVGQPFRTVPQGLRRRFELPAQTSRRSQADRHRYGACGRGPLDHDDTARLCRSPPLRTAASPWAGTAPASPIHTTGAIAAADARSGPRGLALCGLVILRLA